MKMLTVALVSLCALLLSTEVKAQDYYTGDYKICLNLYSFNVNIIAWIKDRDTAPKLDTISAVKWAKQAGYEAINVPFYYVIGYEADSMPSKPEDEILEFVLAIKQTADELGLIVAGSGIGNDFANADAAKRQLDEQRAMFWLDMASVMGAPYMRVFSGLVPTDFNDNWAEIAKDRIAPILKQLAIYGATKGVKIGLQNHGDMTATADQVIQILEWVDHPNIGVVDDTGYFRPFRAENGLNYDWYADIAKVLPYSVDLQAKLKPAGAEQTVNMDFHKLFTNLRLSPYRGVVALERLWAKDDPDNPHEQPTPPYDEVLEFLGIVKKALDDTKIPPNVKEM